MRIVRFYFYPYGVKPCSMKRYYAWALPLNDLCTPPAYFIAMGTAQYSNFIQLKLTAITITSINQLEILKHEIMRSTIN